MFCFSDFWFHAQIKNQTFQERFDIFFLFVWPENKAYILTSLCVAVGAWVQWAHIIC